MKKLFRVMLLCLIVLSTTFVHASIPSWQILPDESHLNFKATQNNAPVTGSFKKFSGDIKFDQNNLTASKVRIIVDMTSVTSGYEDLTQTLLSKDWFDSKAFPQAIFEANNFTKLTDNQYQAKGTLTIRDKSMPLTLLFQLQEIGDGKDKAVGQVSIKRTDFKVGQGEWASTTEVKDEVNVTFDVVAKK